jgi:RNA polymerase sigma-70 factor (ECF subfamily)
VLKLLHGRNEQRGTGDDGPPRVADDLAALVAGCRRGEADATATLLSTLGPSMLRMVRRVMGASDPDVEDVFQEAMMAVVRALPGFRGDCSTRHFGCRVATLTALKARRRKHAGIQEILSPDDEDRGEGADAHDFALASCRRQLLRRLLDELPGAQAEALVLHHIAGLTVEEIAGAASAAIETVRSRLRLAKAALRERIAADPSMLELLEDSL